MAKSPSDGGFKVEPLYWLLILIPVAVVLRFAMPDAGIWIFLASGVAIIPLAGLMGRATENLAETLGAGIGGLLNATFGNAAELIIAVVALIKARSLYIPGDMESLERSSEMLDLVRASITGSLIGNVLLVLGLAILLGGLKNRRQVFNRTAAGMGSILMALSAIGLLLPSVYFLIVTDGMGREPEDIVMLSEEISVILMITYGLSLLFSLKTHSHLFAGPEEELPKTGKHHEPEWSRKTSLIVLLAATAGVAWMSEILIGSVEHAAESMGMSSIFIGVIIVAVVGNAAEHSTAVLVAMKNKMDLAINIAVGSSIQIALFVAPVLVFTSLLIGTPQPLDLHFSILEIVVVLVAVFVLSLVCQDGESHWMEGVMMLAVYVIIALTFFHMPVG